MPLTYGNFFGTYFKKVSLDEQRGLFITRQDIQEDVASPNHPHCSLSPVAFALC